MDTLVETLKLTIRNADFTGTNAGMVVAREGIYNFSK